MILLDTPANYNPILFALHDHISDTSILSMDSFVLVAKVKSSHLCSSIHTVFTYIIYTFSPSVQSQNINYNCMYILSIIHEW